MVYHNITILCTYNGVTGAYMQTILYGVYILLLFIKLAHVYRDFSVPCIGMGIVYVPRVITEYIKIIIVAEDISMYLPTIPTYRRRVPPGANARTV